MIFRKFLSTAVFLVMLISSSAFAEVGQTAVTPSPSVEATPAPPPVVEASPPVTKCSPFVCPDVPLLQRHKNTPSKDVQVDEVKPVKAKTKKAKTKARKTKIKTNLPATETK